MGMVIWKVMDLDHLDREKQSYGVGFLASYASNKEFKGVFFLQLFSVGKIFSILQFL